MVGVSVGGTAPGTAGIRPSVGRWLSKARGRKEHDGSPISVPTNSHPNNITINNTKMSAPDPASVDPPFSIFTHREKRWISSVASFGAMFSTLSSYIYFPALVPMAADLGVSVALVNLTVTSYMIVAGVAPAFMGDLADQGGRRPAYILMFVLVVASNVGLALQRSYPALFVLRMLQSAGASGEWVLFSALGMAGGGG